MKPVVTYKILILVLASGLLAASLVWTKFTVNRKSVKQVENIANSDFNDTHFNHIITDTFTNLLQQAYGTNIAISKEQGKLVVKMSGAGALTKDFFNGNDKVLQPRLDDYGFRIDYDRTANTINAVFKIENDAVPVPNDVMIKLCDRAQNNGLNLNKTIPAKPS